MHPADLSGSREKLYWFLSGWLGGPQHYVERRGHPRLRARHFPFAVDDDAAAQWMACMTAALAETVPDVELRDTLAGALARLALHMRNR
jgi:hemoglobin